MLPDMKWMKIYDMHYIFESPYRAGLFGFRVIL